MAAKRLLFTVMVLAAMALGTYHGKMKYDRAVKNGKTATATRTAVRTSTPAVPAGPRRIPARFDSYMKRADAFYDRGLFGEAENWYRRAAKTLLKEGFGDRPEFERTRRAQHKSSVFAQVMRDIPLNPLLKEDEVTVLEIENMPEPEIGKLASEDNESLTIVNDLNETKTFQKKNVKDRKTLSIKDYEKSLRNKLDKNLEKAKDAVTIYTRGIYFATRNGLNDRLTRLMETAFSEPGWEVIIEVFMTGADVQKLKTMVDKAYGRIPVVVVATNIQEEDPYRTGTGHTPGTNTGRATAVPTGTSREIPRPTGTAAPRPIRTGTATSEPVSTGTAVSRPPATATATSAGNDMPPGMSAEEREAEELFLQGMRIFSKCLPGKPNYRRNMVKAYPLLSRARALFEKLFEKTQEGEYERKLVQVQQAIFFLTREMSTKDLDKINKKR